MDWGHLFQKLFVFFFNKWEEWGSESDDLLKVSQTASGIRIPQLPGLNLTEVASAFALDTGS